jgi:hypothetical protein
VRCHLRMSHAHERLKTATGGIGQTELRDRPIELRDDKFLGNSPVDCRRAVELLQQASKPAGEFLRRLLRPAQRRTSFSETNGFGLIHTSTALVGLHHEHHNPNFVAGCGGLPTDGLFVERRASTRVNVVADFPNGPSQDTDFTCEQRQRAVHDWFRCTARSRAIAAAALMTRRCSRVRATWRRAIAARGMCVCTCCSATKARHEQQANLPPLSRRAPDGATAGNGGGYPDAFARRSSRPIGRTGVLDRICCRQSRDGTALSCAVPRRRLLQ